MSLNVMNGFQCVAKLSLDTQYGTTAISPCSLVSGNRMRYLQRGFRQAVEESVLTSSAVELHSSAALCRESYY